MVNYWSQGVGSEIKKDFQIVSRDNCNTQTSRFSIFNRICLEKGVSLVLHLYCEISKVLLRNLPIKRYLYVRNAPENFLLVINAKRQKSSSTSPPKNYFYSNIHVKIKAYNKYEHHVLFKLNKFLMKILNNKDNFK